MASPENPADTSTSNTSQERDSSGNFECNICFDTAKDSVVSLCGHLFCWSCIYQWMESRPRAPTCPVCKSAIDRERLVPLYGRGNTSGVDPRTTTPPRPAGQRQEVPQNDAGLGFQDIQFSFGIGAFPLFLFGPFLNVFGEGNQQAQMGVPRPREERILAQVFMIITLLTILWLLLS